METITSSYFLPNWFKKVGLLLIASHLGLIALFYIIYLLAPDWNLDYPAYILVPLLRYSVMIGLVLFISSKEKFEDEMIMHIRLKSFQYGLYLTVFVILTLLAAGVSGISGPNGYHLAGVGGVNVMLVFTAAIYQFNIYKLKSDDE